MKLIVGFDALICKMIQLIESAEKMVLILSFEFDLTYTKYDLSNVIKEAIERGVKFYIITSNLGISAPHIKQQSAVALERLREKYPESVFIKPNYSTDENMKFISPYVNYLADLFSYNSYCRSFYNVTPSGVHARYIYNGRELLVSGGVYSQRFIDFPFYETGLLVPDVNIDVERAFHNVYDYSLPNPLTTSGTNMYHYIVYNIHNCKTSIYLENQYFKSNPEDTQNRVCDALIERIGTAIRRKQKFRCEIMTNWDCKDETKIRQNFTDYYTKKSLKYLVTSLGRQFSMELINEYLRDYTHDNTLIHSKIFMFDNKNCLFTTANIYDASFYSRGQLEIGCFIKNDPELCTDIRRGLGNTIPDLRLLPNDFIGNYELNHLYNLSFVKEITFVRAPIHSELTSSPFDDGVCICDNICYDDMKITLPIVYE
jgi:phosphatidylserine/phosphatidylglycerophosphate/cardiolipin synthase-like enzyme